MSMQIRFPGGTAVTADYAGFEIRTDQPAAKGGADSAPSPFDLFLASLGTCAGYFALRFCQQRDLNMEGMRLELETSRDADSGRLDRVSIRIHLPADFPEKYRQAIVRATDQCAVKKVLHDPPEIAVSAS